MLSLYTVFIRIEKRRGSIWLLLLVPTFVGLCGIFHVTLMTAIKSATSPKNLPVMMFLMKHGCMFGLWPTSLGLFAYEVNYADWGDRSQLCCFPVTVYTRFYPLVLCLIFQLFGFQPDILIGTFTGYFMGIISTYIPGINQLRVSERQLVRMEQSNCCGCLIRHTAYVAPDGTRRSEEDLMREAVEEAANTQRHQALFAGVGHALGGNTADAERRAAVERFAAMNPEQRREMLRQAEAATRAAQAAAQQAMGGAYGEAGAHHQTYYTNNVAGMQDAEYAAAVAQQLEQRGGQETDSDSLNGLYNVPEISHTKDVQGEYVDPSMSHEPTADHEVEIVNSSEIAAPAVASRSSSSNNRSGAAHPLAAKMEAMVRQGTNEN